MNQKNIYQKINNLAQKIVEEYDPDKIILFGSYAWGNAGPDSDIDLFVIKDSQESRRKRQIKLRHLLLDFDMPADILAYTPQEIERRLSIQDFFIKNIINKGKLVYEKSR